MNFKVIYDLIMFAGFGGPVMFIGALIGLYIGLNVGYEANQAAACFLDCIPPLENPETYKYAVFGAIPGMLIAGYYAVQKQRLKSED